MPPNNSRRTNQYIPQRSYKGPVAGSTLSSARQSTTQDAAANIVRSQIENIFQKDSRATPAATQQPEASQPQSQPQNQPQPRQQPATQPAEKPRADGQPLPRIQAASTSFDDTSHSSPDSPYDKTHEAGRTNVPADQWKHYHSAWQDYYRQYYERYYIGEIYRMRETTQPNAEAAPSAVLEKTNENEDIFNDLRADLLRNVRTSATKVRRSQHFIPVLAACLVVMLFLFLQYNRILFANVEAYVSPGSINPANIIVDPNIDIPVSDESRLIIPKINVDVPVVYDTKNDQASQLKAMEKGVAWFGIPGANSKPGQVGNTVLSGHSSNDLFDPGDYKFIFARLDQLVVGDTFYANYQGKRYIYSITKKEVVLPTEVQKLVYPTEKPVMTLITCVPLGTAQKRLLVTAEQISPSPSQAIEAPSEPDSGTTEDAAMPGNSPSLIGRLFG